MKKNLLKRIVSVALCAAMTLPFCLSVSAETTNDTVIQTATSDTAEDTSYFQYYGITKLPSSKTLDEDVRNDIIDDYLKTINVDGKEYTREDITLDYYGYYGDLGNFSILVHIENPDTVHNEEIHYIPINDCIYVYTTGTDVVIYRDNAFYSIEELIATDNLTDQDISNIRSKLGLEHFITQSDLKSLLRGVQTPGDTYTPETAKPFYAATEKARNLIEAENPSYRDLTLAYYELKEAAANLELLVVDKTMLSLCYHYCESILDNYLDYYDESAQELISETKFDAQLTLLYPENEEYFYGKTDEIVEIVKTFKPSVENADIPLFEDILAIREKADAYLKNYSSDEDDINIYCPEFLDFDGYKIVSASTNVVLPTILSKRVNGCILESNNYYIPSDLGYLAINTETGDVLELEEAIENGVIDVEKLYAYNSANNMRFDMYLIGDADSDGKLSIKDATLVQKASVELEEIVYTEYQNDTTFDCNGDGTVNVTDATAIQKTIVS